jgi:hypothetical protein
MPKNALAPTPTNAFLESRDTSWADKYGGVVPYYPNQTYIDKNYAPELNISQQQLEALAEANQQAKRSGLMSSKLADRMLPTLLTEATTGISGWGYPDTPRYRAILEKAGLPPTIKEITKLPIETDYDRHLIQSKLMHAVMAAKAAQYGEDKAIERWNGQGKVMDGNAVYADAANHARKVGEIERLLQHPKNQAMRNTWADMSAKYAGNTPPATARSLPDRIPNEDDPYFLYKIKQALGYEGAFSDIPKNALVKGQNALRNWTAY